MTNRITFTIETEAPYTEEERDGLLDNFLAFINEEDADVVGGSEEISIVDVNDISSDDEKINAAIIKKLSSSTFTFNVSIDLDDVEFERGAATN